MSASLPVRVSASNKPLMTTAPINLESRNGEAVSADVSTAVSNPFPDKPITLSGTPTITSGQGTVTTSGTNVTITPAAGFHGTITAQYKVLDSTGSESRAVTGTITVQVGGVAPTAPSGVNVAPVDADSARVSWTDASANGSPVTGYKVNVNGSEQTCTTSNCLINNLVPGQTYTVQVVATNKYGDSEATTVPYQHNATAKTPAAPSLAAGSRKGHRRLDRGGRPLRGRDDLRRATVGRNGAHGPHRRIGVLRRHPGTRLHRSGARPVEPGNGLGLVLPVQPGDALR